MAGPSLLSDLMGYASISCWLGAQFPQVLENIRRQSCDGLALPFLANWLLGDISNLIGCLLTHQLPFQTWLATYFVFVDCALVAQYFYYYRPQKMSSPTFGHVRSATTPAIARRMSVDRGISRYRTLSAVAAHVAQTAALAAQQSDDHIDARSPPGRQRFSAHEGSESLASRMTEGDSEVDDDALAVLADSFHSEGGRDRRKKRVSWSIERAGERAGSVGRHTGIARTTRPAALHLSDESLNGSDLLNRGRPLQRDMELLSDVEEAVSSLPNSSRRESKASRRGATMVFLGAWALFGIGTLAGSRRGLPSTTTMNIGRVLSTRDFQVPDSVSAVVSTPDITSIPVPNYESLDFNAYVMSIFDEPPSDEPPSSNPSAERVIGRIFAWLCTTLYLTSRLPQIWKNFVRKSVEGLSMFLFIFAFLGNTFYVASILFSPNFYLPPPESTEFIKESIPYLLGSGGTLLFDVTIITQSFIYRPKHRRHHNRMVEEEEGLLGGDALSAHPPLTTGGSAITSRGRISRTRSTGQP